jgi:hypothetical protein
MAEKKPKHERLTRNAGFEAAARRLLTTPKKSTPLRAAKSRSQAEEDRRIHEQLEAMRSRVEENGKRVRDDAERAKRLRRGASPRKRKSN